MGKTGSNEYPLGTRAAPQTSEQTRALMNGEAPKGRRGAGAGEGVCGAAGAVLAARRAGPRAPVLAWCLRRTPCEEPGRPCHSGGEGGHRYIQAPGARRPREDSRGAGTARLPAPPQQSALGRHWTGLRRLRAPSVWSRPSLPSRRLPGSLTFHVVPHHHARRRRLVRPRGPPRTLPPHRALAGRRAGERVTQPRRAAISEGGTARSATDPAPPPRRERATASPRPLRATASSVQVAW